MIELSLHSFGCIKMDSERVPFLFVEVIFWFIKGELLYEDEAVDYE